MLSVAESHPEPEREERGDLLLLVHCANVGRERPSAYARLVEQDRWGARAATSVRSDRLSRPARLVLAVDADEQEHQEADDGADDEAHGAAVADRRAADPNEEPEEERPRERDDAVVERGWAGEGASRARTVNETGPKKIHRAGCAFVHLPREPSASAYGPRERLRPTRAPCSVQEGRYRCAVDVQVASACLVQFADNSVCAALARDSCRALDLVHAKIHRAGGAFVHLPREPRLPPRALGSGFDLLALRARCKSESPGVGRVRASRSPDAGLPHFARREMVNISTTFAAGLGRTLWISGQGVSRSGDEPRRRAHRRRRNRCAASRVDVRPLAPSSRVHAAQGESRRRHVSMLT